MGLSIDEIRQLSHEVYATDGNHNPRDIIRGAQHALAIDRDLDDKLTVEEMKAWYGRDGWNSELLEKAIEANQTIVLREPVEMARFKKATHREMTAVERSFLLHAESAWGDELTRADMIAAYRTILSTVSSPYFQTSEDQSSFKLCDLAFKELISLF